MILFLSLAKLVPLAYGIHKLQISCVVEDDKVISVITYITLIIINIYNTHQIGTDFLEEAITAFEDIVQSVDVAAFNKV